MISYPASVIGESDSKIALLAQAALLRKHLVDATTLCKELTHDLLRSTEQAAEPKDLREYQAKLRKQIKASTLDIKLTEDLIELIARSV